MNKYEVDEYYHDLRMLYLSSDVQQKEAILGITTHLTTPEGDYNGLLRYLAWYGESYLLPEVLGVLHQSNVKFSRIVDFGAGLGWLGRGIADGYKGLPTLFVDKRQWVLTDIIADLETTNGRDRVLDALQPGDIIVMSELLHCLDNPEKVLKPFEKWPMLVVEYSAWSSRYMQSYNEQIAKFGCVPVVSLGPIFPGRRISSRPVEPYKIAFIYPVTGKK